MFWIDVDKTLWIKVHNTYYVTNLLVWWQPKPCLLLGRTGHKHLMAGRGAGWTLGKGGSIHVCCYLATNISQTEPLHILVGDSLYTRIPANVSSSPPSLLLIHRAGPNLGMCDFPPGARMMTHLNCDPSCRGYYAVGNFQTGLSLGCFKVMQSQDIFTHLTSSHLQQLKKECCIFFNSDDFEICRLQTLNHRTRDAFALRPRRPGDSD